MKRISTKLDGHVGFVLVVGGGPVFFSLLLWVEKTSLHGFKSRRVSGCRPISFSSSPHVFHVIRP